MKRKEIETLKSMTAEELGKLVRERREKLRALQFDLAAGKVKNVSELRAVRKEIARLLTFAQQKNRN